MRYYMLNKPGGVVTATVDKTSGTVMDCFPEEIRPGLFPVGRLDRDTEGLLIVTDDGDFAHRILTAKGESSHPSHRVSAILQMEKGGVSK